MSSDTTTATDGTFPPRADVCAVAIAEAFRGDGERLCNPIGNLPLIGGRLAASTFEPHLAMTDGFYAAARPTSRRSGCPSPSASSSARSGSGTRTARCSDCSGTASAT